MAYFDSDTRGTVFTVALGMQLLLLILATMITGDTDPVYLLR